MVMDMRASGVSPLPVGVELFRWRHVQAAVRLLQVVHVLADVITDWDAVIDCFEQVTICLFINLYVCKYKVVFYMFVNCILVISL